MYYCKCSSEKVTACKGIVVPKIGLKGYQAYSYKYTIFIKHSATLIFTTILQFPIRQMMHTIRFKQKTILRETHMGMPELNMQPSNVWNLYPHNSRCTMIIIDLFFTFEPLLSSLASLR
jgi:hypothetical protein